MKKILGILACSALLVSIAACGSDTSRSESISLPNEAISHTESESSSTMQNSSKNKNAYTTETFKFVTLNDTANPFSLSIGDTFGNLTFSKIENNTVYGDYEDFYKYQLATFTCNEDIVLKGKLSKTKDSDIVSFKPDIDKESLNEFPFLEFFYSETAVFYLVLSQSLEEISTMLNSPEAMDTLMAGYPSQLECSINISSYQTGGEASTWSGSGGFCLADISSITI